MGRVLLAVIALPATVSAASVDAGLWGTDGYVTAIARERNTLYIGGAFTTVGPNTGCGVPVDSETGVPVARYPRVTGDAVSTVIPDGEGGWFIGGRFVAVGGVARSNLAHVLADGDVADWTPDPDGEVLALAIYGSTLYVAGSFGTLGGQPRKYLGAVDILTGRVTDWNPAPDASVRALLLDHRNLLIGGDFGRIGGQVRNSLAQEDVVSGLLTTWDPNVGWYGAPGKVRALVQVGDTVYVGGDFASVGGQSRALLASVDATTGTVTMWDPHGGGPDDPLYGNAYVGALAAYGNSIYVGGHFTEVGGQVRGGLAQVDAVSGALGEFDPLPTAGADITALAICGARLYVSGGFTEIAGQSRRFCAALDLGSGLPTDFAPRPSEPISVLAVSGRVVYTGGSFFSLGGDWVPRAGLAGLDATTGAVKAWDPSPAGLIVSALAIARGQVYVGGYFWSIGGKTRYGLAAVDTLTGAATEWDPTANGAVSSLVAAGDTLYVGGYFTTMSGQPRGRLASFDLASGVLTDWNPNAGDDVYAVAVKGSTVYVAGFFWTIGGLTRKGVAAVNATDGAVADWDPGTDDWASAIAVVGDSVIVGGHFHVIGGQGRENLGAVTLSTGLATPWMADANSPVGALAVMGDTLFVGGGFHTIAGEPRSGLAAFDCTTGALTDWRPDTGGGVAVLSVAGSTLYVGGGMTRMDLVPASGIAEISFGSPPSVLEPIPRSLTLAPLVPNPTHAGTSIRFALPSAGPVSLGVFDVQGRRVASPLQRVVMSAGWHDLAVRTDAWHAGVYFCRLDGGGVNATRKFVVVR